MLNTKRFNKKKICQILLIIAIINSVSFILVSQALGGNAAIGKVEKGNYYLGNHGKYTLVSRGVFIYSLIHDRSEWFTMPLGIIALATLSAIKKS